MTRAPTLGIRFPVAAALSITIWCSLIAPLRAHEGSHPPAKSSAPALPALVEGAAPGEVTYLGNEGLLVSKAKHKILFDPFFHNAFDSLQLVPKSIARAIMKGQKPYDGVELIFVSHAHEDHFSAIDMKRFLRAYRNAKLIAPKQAVEELAALPGTAGLMSQVIAVDLNFGDAPWQTRIGDIQIEAVRIAHKGWPERKDIENLVFRVTIENTPGDKLTVMHLGDADPDAIHFTPFAPFWQKQRTDTAFPPYWFYLSAEGNQILDRQINSARSIGIHVPVEVPDELRATGKPFFTRPADKRTLGSIESK